MSPKILELIGGLEVWKAEFAGSFLKVFLLNFYIVRRENNSL